MKNLSLIILCLCLSSCNFHNNISKSLPPKYLSIKGYQKCTSTQSMGTWNSICLPIKIKKYCNQNTYNILKNNTRIPLCEK